MLWEAFVVQYVIICPLVQKVNAPFLLLARVWSRLHRMEANAIAELYFLVSR